MICPNLVVETGFTEAKIFDDYSSAAFDPSPARDAPAPESTGASHETAVPNGGAAGPAEGPRYPRTFSCWQSFTGIRRNGFQRENPRGREQRSKRGPGAKLCDRPQGGEPWGFRGCWDPTSCPKERVNTEKCFFFIFIPLICRPPWLNYFFAFILFLLSYVVLMMEHQSWVD